MEIRRFFVDTSDIVGDTVTIVGDEFVHLTRVLRYKVGYKAIVCANDGVENLCTVQSIDKTCAVLHIDERKIVDSKSIKLTLYAGVLKNNKLDFAIQKAVELGVDTIVPFISANSAEKDFNAERARKIAIEAAKQCGSAYLTEILSLRTFDEIIDNLGVHDKVLFAYECEKKHRIKDVLFKGGDYALIVGCEGGFQPIEAEKAARNGAEIVTLGKRILRAETADIVACALTLDALGELNYE